MGTSERLSKLEFSMWQLIAEKETYANMLPIVYVKQLFMLLLFGWFKVLQMSVPVDDNDSYNDLQIDFTRKNHTFNLDNVGYISKENGE